jgi:hypothetical protein
LGQRVKKEHFSTLQEGHEEIFWRHEDNGARPQHECDDARKKMHQRKACNFVKDKDDIEPELYSAFAEMVAEDNRLKHEAESEV